MGMGREGKNREDINGFRDEGVEIALELWTGMGVTMNITLGIGIGSRD